MPDRRFALLIGNGTYDHLGDLHGPKHDVEQLRRVLEDPNIGAFESVTPLCDQPADSVRQRIEGFFADKKRDDLLLIYFSGHGLVTGSGRLYLAVKNTNRDLLHSTGVSAQFITRIMDDRSLQRVVLVLDSCYSGAHDRGAKGEHELQLDLGEIFASGYGRVVMTATRATERAWDGGALEGDAETDCSLFTHYLIEGLTTGGAGGASERVTVNAWYDYAQEKVAEALASLPAHRQQHPKLWIEQDGPPLIIARNPHPALPQLEPEAIAGHHVISYSAVDGEAAALRLYDALTERGVPVWLDQRDVQQPGPPWDAQVDQALQGCRSLLLLVTPAVADGDCQREWRLALRYKKPIVPLRMDAAADVPFYLSNRDSLRFTGAFDAAVTDLQRHLHWLATPAGTLRTLEDRLSDARRDLRRATSTERTRIRQEIQQLTRQIKAQRQVVNDPEQQQAIAEQRIQSGLERERTPERPTTGVRDRGKFINPPPMVAPAYFQDRTVELGLLGDYLKDDACRLITVVGRAGVGKTAMTCLLLEALEKGRLPTLDGSKTERGERLDVDGIVYLSAVGQRRIGVPHLYADLCELLDDETAQRLDALYQDPKVSTRAKMQALLAAFPRRRVIVLLDNFEDVMDPATRAVTDEELDEALRALVTAPHHSVNVILTTRVAPRALALVEPGRQRCLELDTGLKSPHAENALRAMDADGAVGLKTAPEAQLAEARDLTRGYPRALEALYGILSADRHTRLQEILAEADELPPETVVEALVGQAFSRLDEAARQVMQALAVYDRPVTPAAVDYLLQPYRAGIDSAPVLNRLVSAHFVRKDGGRYHLHPVDRAYAFARIPEGSEADRPAPEPSIWKQLIPKIRGNTSSESQQPVWSQVALLHRGADYFRQARLPRAEWRTLDDLAPQLAEFDLRCAGGEYEAAAQVLQSIDFDYLLLWGHYHLMARLHERLQSQLEDPTLKQSNAGNLGTALANMGQIQKAIVLYEDALTIAREQEDKHNEGVWLGNLGLSYADLGQTQRAIELHEQALAIAREIGDRAGEGRHLGNLGLCYYSLGQTQRAIEFYEQALAIAREIGNRQGESATLGNLGICYADLGQTQRAIELYEQALTIDREVGYRQGEGIRLGNLAEALIDQGHYDEAIQRAQESIKIGEEINNPVICSHSHGQISLVQLYNGDLHAARAAAEAAREYDVPELNHTARALLGVIALRQGDRDAAQAAFTAAVDAADTILAHTADYYDALDAKGLALAGLALCEPERDRVARRLQQAQAAYGAARAINRDAGIVARVLRLLDALAAAAPAGLLDGVRAAAAGDASQKSDFLEKSDFS
jgi:tetratricopeptide (TPR) repeat protein